MRSSAIDDKAKKEKEVKGPARLRVQLDFSQETFDRLEGMKDDTHAESKAEVVRNALRLYEWIIEQSKEGRFIESQAPDGTQVSRVEAKWFLR